MCCLLVSGFLTEITQQIHSLRASGVMSSHFARATESEMRTFRKSGGTLCSTPGEIAFLLINFILLRYAVRDQKLEIHMDDYSCVYRDLKIILCLLGSKPSGNSVSWSYSAPSQFAPLILAPVRVA